ncbi:zinc-binding dehydrogenase [Kribbella deserti]|uniref:Zinc-binding dehydrogenase n=1 Tax=Kribbella deserti TaxID=1926257 RepID=A0ABV6QP42_9ACTN
MRAAVVTRFGGPEVIETQEWPEPVARAGQVVLDVVAADVIFVETQIRAGLHGDFFTVEPPYVPGSSVGGTVRSVGEGVDPAWIGKKVVARPEGFGSHAEQVAVPAAALSEVPEGLWLTEAVAGAGDAWTALVAFDRSGTKPGDSVLITAAAGGMGVLLIQLAKAAGATVIGAARGQAKLDLIKAQGADLAIDYSEPGWQKKVLDATDGKGVRIAFEGAGGETGGQAFQTVAPGGWISAHGAASGEFASIDPAEADRKGITVGGIAELQPTPGQADELNEQVLTALATGRLKPVIDRTFRLDEVGAAHEAIEARTLLGKALIVP